MRTTFKYLPFSGRRYELDTLGNVYLLGMELVPKEVTDKTVVDLEWIFGKCEYEIGLLMILTYFDIALPEHLWNCIEPLYKDGDSSNANFDNLTYRFKGGLLPLEDMNDFYYVPFFTRYAINKSGTLINAKTKKAMTWWVSKPQAGSNSTGGYHSCRVVVDEERNSKMLFRHKALCLVFKPYGADVHELITNHIDGIPSNDDLDNLEWATYGENNSHAYATGLKPNSCRAVLMKDGVTGEITRFPSIIECSKFSGLSSTRILYRMSNAAHKHFRDQKLFKYDDDTPWPPITTEAKFIGFSKYVNKEVCARDVFTGRIVVADDIASLSEAIGIKESTILAHLKRASHVPVHGYNFRWFDNASIIWPSHSERHLLIYKEYPLNPPNGLVIRDLMTGKEEFYTSLTEGRKALGLEKTTLSKYIKSRETYQDRFIFEVFEIKKDIGPSQE